MRFLTAIRRLLCLIALLAAVPGAVHAQSASDFKVYVTLPGSNSVAVVDGLTNSVVNTIAVPAGSGFAPFSVALTPDAKFAYVVNSQDCADATSFAYNQTPNLPPNPLPGFVWVLDTASNRTVAVIPVDLCPQEIAITPDGTRAYVTNFGSNTLSVIDTASNTVLQSVSLPDIPDGLAITPDGSRVYVATSLTVSVVSTATNSIVASIPTPIPGCTFSELAVTPDGQEVYVTGVFDAGCPSAFIISTQTNSFVFSFPPHSFPIPWGVAITPDGKKAFVASHNGAFDPLHPMGGETFMIDTGTRGFFAHPMCRFDVFTPSACRTTGISLPIFVEITPDGKKAYFSANATNPAVTGELMVFDLANDIIPGNVSAIASVLFSTVPAGIAIAPMNNTPIGMNVTAQPLDKITKTSPVTVTFSNVTQAGFTSLFTSTTGPTLPTGFQLAGVYYNLATTAQFTGNITICVTSPAVTSSSQLWHFASSGSVDVTSLPVIPPTICGTVLSLSPFAILQPGGSTSTVTTTLSSSANPSVFGQIVTLTASATASGSGTPTGAVTFLDGNSPLAVVTLNGGPATFSTSTLAVGSHSFTISYGGDASFAPSTSSVLVQTVNPAPLTLTANNASRQYGQANPVFSVSYGGFVNGDGPAALSGTLSCMSIATPSSPVNGGPYAINCAGLSSPNYAITYVPAQLVITPAPLMIAANNASRPYGAYNPAFTGTIIGLRNTDPISASYSTSATPASLVGPYPIIPTAVGLGNVLGNYTVLLVNGVLTIGQETTSLTVTLSPFSIIVGQSTTATLTLTAPDMVIPIDPSVLAAITLNSPVVSDILMNNGVCTPVPSAAPGVATCTVAVTAVEPNGRTLKASFPATSALSASTGTADLVVTAPLESKVSCIKSDFRNVAVPGGSYLWFNSIFKVKDVNKQKVTITFFQSSVQFQYRDASNNLVTANQALPDAKITIDPSVSTASTNFDAVDNLWITTVPFDLDDAMFLTGIPWLVPAGGLPPDIEPVTWCGTFASDTAGVDIGWRWAAAAYSSFSSDNTVLGVKPMKTDHDNPPVNRANAGTPENFKVFVIPGARGKGGKNYTGSYSGSAEIE